MLKIYIDNCCYGRPFDSPSSPSIVFESTAKIFIQSLVLNNELTLVNSFVLYEEIKAIPNKENRRLILKFLDNATVYVAKDKYADILTLAMEIMELGVKYMDASHIACAVLASCDYFITTDKRLLKYKSDRLNIINPVDFIRIWEGDNLCLQMNRQ